MKILHTSDWHLGRRLYGRRRYPEFAAFLAWLLEVLEEERVELLLVTGDIFDSTTPGNRAQELYYDFLCRAAAAGRRQIVITAGNHDSPTFLEAPKALLRALNVHVIGLPAEDPADEIITIRAPDGRPVLLVAAVPYLRDREMRTAAAGESIAEKEEKLVAGIREHYRAVAAAAVRKCEKLGQKLPIIATGHLFTSGGETIAGDGVRKLYLGSLGHFPADGFPENFAYIALGHLHQPQRVGGGARIRYSGAPLVHGFGEAGRGKEILLLELDEAGRSPVVTPRPVPVFQPLAQIRGDLGDIRARLEELARMADRVWLEIIYEGRELTGNLREEIEKMIAGSDLELLNLRNRRLLENAGDVPEAEVYLEELSPEKVFALRLESAGVPEEQQAEVTAAYREILTALAEQDSRADNPGRDSREER